MIWRKWWTFLIFSWSKPQRNRSIDEFNELMNLMKQIDRREPIIKKSRWWWRFTFSIAHCTLPNKISNHTNSWWSESKTVSTNLMKRDIRIKRYHKCRNENECTKSFNNHLKINLYIIAGLTTLICRKRYKTKKNSKLKKKTPVNCWMHKWNKGQCITCSDEIYHSSMEFFLNFAIPNKWNGNISLINF